MKKAGGELTPMERAIDRSTFHVDVAACIRSTLFGLAILILTIAILLHPESVSLSNATEAFARIFLK